MRVEVLMPQLRGNGRQVRKSRICAVSIHIICEGAALLAAKFDSWVPVELLSVNNALYAL